MKIEKIIVHYTGSNTNMTDADIKYVGVDKVTTVSTLKDIFAALNDIQKQESKSVPELINAGMVDFVPKKKKTTSSKKDVIEKPVESKKEEKVEPEKKEEVVESASIERHRRSDKYEKEARSLNIFGKSKKTEEPTEEVVEEETETVSKKRLPKKLLIKTAVGAVTVVALLYAGSVLVPKNIYTSEKKNNKKDEQSFDTSIPNNFNVTYRTDSANEVYNDNLTRTTNNVDPFIEMGKKVARNDSISRNDLEDHINNMTSLMSSGITELDDFINGKRNMGGSQYNIAFEQFFEPGSADYVAVQRYCSIRNQILSNAYQTQNRNTALTNVKTLLNELTDFIYCGQNAQGTNVYFSDLSSFGRYVVFTIENAFLTVNIDYSKNVNGNPMTRMDLMNEGLLILNDTMEELESRIGRRY